MKLISLVAEKQRAWVKAKNVHRQPVQTYPSTETWSGGGKGEKKFRQKYRLNV